MERDLIEFGESHKAQGMTSLQIAEVTGKMHKHVLRDIRNLLDQGVSETNFGLSSYKQEQPNGGTKEVVMYELTPKGCLILASGYDPVLREKIVDKLEEYQQAERSKMVALPDFTDPAEAAMAWAKEYREKKVLAIENQSLQIENARLETENIELVAENQELKNDRNYLEIIMRSRKMMTISQIAQDYGMSGKAMNQKLAEMGIQYKCNDQWILYARYKDCGYVSSRSIEITRANGMPDVVLHTEWTQAGRRFLYEELKKEGIIPMLERD
jgi:phage regulator Rha-like protein